MATSRSDIVEWFQEGLKQGATHLLVVCDTFDHEDFPKYVMPGEDPHAVKLGEMSRLMEVYNLRKPMMKQLNEYRSFNY